MYILIRTNHELKKVETIEIDSLKWSKIEQRKLSNSGDIGFVYNKALPPIELDVLTMYMCWHVKKGLSIERLLILLDDIKKMERFVI